MISLDALARLCRDIPTCPEGCVQGPDCRYRSASVHVADLELLVRVAQAVEKCSAALTWATGCAEEEAARWPGSWNRDRLTELRELITAIDALRGKVKK